MATATATNTYTLNAMLNSSAPLNNLRFVKNEVSATLAPRAKYIRKAQKACNTLHPKLLTPETSIA